MAVTESCLAELNFAGVVVVVATVDAKLFAAISIETLVLFLGPIL